VLLRGLVLAAAACRLIIALQPARSSPQGPNGRFSHHFLEFGIQDERTFCLLRFGPSFVLAGLEAEDNNSREKKKRHRVVIISPIERRSSSLLFLRGGHKSG